MTLQKHAKRKRPVWILCLTRLKVEEDSIHEARHALSLLEIVYYDLSFSSSVTDQSFFYLLHLHHLNLETQQQDLITDIFRYIFLRLDHC